MSKKSDDIFEPPMPNVPPGWDILPFQQAALVISDNGRHVKQGAYLLAGKLIVIDQGQNSMGGYTDDETMAFNGELPVILFGDHTRSIKFVDKRFAVGAEGIKILKPTPSYNPKFFYYLLRSLQIPSRGYSRHFQFLKKFHLPIAPPNEQKHIVAEIEKQFSRLDEAVAGLKRIKANLKRYKAAVLKAAVEGKLTEEWRKAHPPTETGAELLKRILAERKKKWEEKNPGKKYKEPVAPNTSNLPELPKGWVWASLDSICYQIGDVDHKMPKARNEGIPYISTKDFLSAGDIDYENSKRIDQADYNQLCRKIVPERRDILLSRYGTIGEVRLVKTKQLFQASYSIAIIKPIVDYMSDYLSLVLQTEPTQRQIKKYTRATSQPDLGLAHIRLLGLPLPPNNEQQQLIEEVARLFSVTQEIEATVEINLKRAERMRQSILMNAFMGKLGQSQ